MLRCSSVSRALQRSPQLLHTPQPRAFTRYETITIPVASNGSIQLNVYNPLTSSAASRVALYLPRGPIFQNPDLDAVNIETLRAVVPCHIVEIKYRHGIQYQYPTPIHDVLAGFDWAVTNLLPKRAITRVGRSEHVGRLAVFGELLGGSLAAALALTECRAGEPGVVAAALNNPVLDWVDLPSAAAKMPAVPSNSFVDALLSQRKNLFRRSEHYFDPFASPTLFFRTAGYEVPEDSAEPALSEMDELALLERQEYLREQDPTLETSNIKEAMNRISKEDTRVKQRKSSRKYPAKALGLQLPSFNITTGQDAPLLSQANEFIHLLKRSYDRQSKTGSSDDWADMLHFRQCPGHGLWDETPAGRDGIHEAAAWIAERLED